MKNKITSSSWKQYFILIKYSPYDKKNQGWISWRYIAIMRNLNIYKDYGVSSVCKW